MIYRTESRDQWNSFSVQSFDIFIEKLFFDGGAGTSGIVSPDKDDLNIIYNKAGPGRTGRFVDMQIVWQNWSLRYCDNGGCDRRRVVSAKLSDDGVTWGHDLELATPDSQVITAPSALRASQNVKTELRASRNENSVVTSGATIV